MCSNITKGSKRILPYTTLPIITNAGIKQEPWGFGGVYNSRIETLTKNNWYAFLPAYLEVEYFYEGIALFEDISSTNMYLLCARSILTNGFMVVTKSSKGTIIEPYHHRQPILLEKPELFLKTGKIVEINYQERLKLVS